MIKSKPFITNISLILTSLLSVSLIIISSIYSHQLSVLKKEYQIQSGILWRYQKNIVYQESQTNQQDYPDCTCPEQEECQQCEECKTQTCDDMLQCVTKESCSQFITLSNCQEQYDECQIQTCDMLQCVTKEGCSQFITLSNCQEQYDECQTEEYLTPTKSSNLFLLEGTYEGQTYQKVIKFQIINSTNTDYTIEEVCTEQDQNCEYSPDNIITLNADGELELTADNSFTNKLLSSDSTTWTTSSWGMPWSKNAIKVNLPVYASESDVLLQKNIQKIKSSSSVGQIEVEEIGTVNSKSITNIMSNNIDNITINDETVPKKEHILEGIRQLSSSQNGISYISSPKISNITSNTIETIATDYALSIKLTSVGIADTTKTAIEITNGVSGRIKIGGDISCNSETEACVDLGNINNANNGYALDVSGNVKSPVLFSKSSVISATFTNEGSLSDVVNKGTFNSIQNKGVITNGIINNKGTIGDITNQANSQLGSVVNVGSMTSFTNKGTATNMKNEGGTITKGLQINGGSIGSTSIEYGLSINGDTTIQGSDVGILIGNDGSKDDIKIQTEGGVYGILIQQATIGHTGLHRGINIDNRGSYYKNSPWVNIYSKSDQYNGQDSYAIFVGPNNVKLHSSTSDNNGDNHMYYYMDPKIHTDFWGAITAGNQFTCKGTKVNG